MVRKNKIKTLYRVNSGDMVLESYPLRPAHSYPLLQVKMSMILSISKYSAVRWTTRQILGMSRALLALVPPPPKPIITHIMGGAAPS